MPNGDLIKEAVVCAASSGKPINLAMRVAMSDTGRRKVRKLTIIEATVAKLEFLRKGYVM